jgi:sec-independent protein translocase protein TatA
LEDVVNLGAPEIVLLIIAALLLFGYKRLPDASRSLGRSLRIFKGEMKGMKDDDVATRDPATTTPARGQLPAPIAPAPSAPVSSADGDLTAQLEEEARIAEAHAAQLRARAEQARSGSADGVR